MQSESAGLIAWRNGELRRQIVQRWGEQYQFDSFRCWTRNQWKRKGRAILPGEEPLKWERWVMVKRSQEEKEQVFYCLTEFFMPWQVEKPTYQTKEPGTPEERKKRKQKWLKRHWFPKLNQK